MNITLYLHSGKKQVTREYESYIQFSQSYPDELKSFERSKSCFKGIFIAFRSAIQYY